MSNGSFTVSLNNSFSLCDMAEKIITRAIAEAAKQGMSEQQLREALGISAGRFSNWKRRDVPAVERPALARLLGWSTDRLLGLGTSVQEPVSPWPFTSLPAARFQKLKPGEQLAVEGAALDKIIEIEKSVQAKSGKTRHTG